MDDTTDFEVKKLSEDKRERLKEDYKQIAQFFGATSTVVVEGEHDCFFHLEFATEEEFEAFADYMRAHGVQGLDVKESEDDSVH